MVSAFLEDSNERYNWNTTTVYTSERASVLFCVANVSVPGTAAADQ